MRQHPRDDWGKVSGSWRGNNKKDMIKWWNGEWAVIIVFLGLNCVWKENIYLFFIIWKIEKIFKNKELFSLKKIFKKLLIQIHRCFNKVTVILAEKETYVKSKIKKWIL